MNRVTASVGLTVASGRDRPSEASGRDRRVGRWVVPGRVRRVLVALDRARPSGASGRDRVGRLPSEVRKVVSDRPNPSEASGRDLDRPSEASGRDLDHP